MAIPSSAVYTDLIISTIVDTYDEFFALAVGLYGLDNFYYRRSQTFQDGMFLVYTDLIISTIVDRKSPVIFSAEEVYKDLIISTIVDAAC